MKQRRLRLELEPLEDRCLLSVIPVSNVNELRAAIRNAANNDIIECAGGGYFTQDGFLDANNLFKNLTIRAAPGAVVQIDGGRVSDLLRYGYSANPGTEIQFQNLVFQSGGSGTEGIAGGVTILNANATFTSCTFINDFANTNTGGGALNISGDSTVQFNGCTWSQNSAHRSGGAMEIQGGAHVAIELSLFTGNLAGGTSGSQGGALHIGNSAVTISNTRFEGNQAGILGGAIAMQGVFDGSGAVRATLNASNCTFAGNKAELIPGIPLPIEAVAGGAVTVEDAASANITLCRFLNNQAGTAGAVIVDRGSAVIDQCDFENNHAVNVGPNTGFAGAILVLNQSRVTAEDPSGSKHSNGTLTVRNTLITGDPTGAPVAQEGGGIAVTGDRNRLDGNNGVPAGGSIQDNQAVAVLDNVIFTNLVVRTTLDGNGVPNSASGYGGALFVELAKVTLANSLIMNCQAQAANPGNPTENNATGGGVCVIGESEVTVQNVTFSNNSAEHTGAALYVKASALNVDSSIFVDNRLTRTTTVPFASPGSAIATDVDPTLNPALPLGAAAGTMLGTVQNSLFSRNSGIALYEFDLPSGSDINQVVYNNNRFFVDPTSEFGATGLVYVNQLDGAHTAAELNVLVEPPGTGRSPKSTVGGNQNTNGAPVVVQLFAAPNRLYQFTTPFDGSGVTSGFVGFVLSGVGSGVLNTPRGPVGVGAPNGLQATTASGVFTLQAGGQVAAAQVLLPKLVATGADAGALPNVHVFDALTGTMVYTVLPYNSAFHGGVRVAMGDVNGDGFPDFITTTGPGGGPDVKVINGQNGALLSQFFVYQADFEHNLVFTGGVYVTAGDVNHDGADDIIVGADAGGGPDVKALTLVTGTPVVLRQFFAYDMHFTGGVRVGAGDVNGDGFADIITAAGPGGGPDVAVYSGATGDRLFNFFAFDMRFTGGLFVAGGDVNGDGFADIVCGADKGGGPNVTVFDGRDQSRLASFFPYNPAFTGGVRVASTDATGDGRAEVVAAAGPGGGPAISVDDGLSGAVIDAFFAYDPRLGNGVFVAARP